MPHGMPHATSALLVTGALVASALSALSAGAPAGATSQTGIGAPIPRERAAGERRTRSSLASRPGPLRRRQARRPGGADARRQGVARRRLLPDLERQACEGAVPGRPDADAVRQGRARARRTTARAARPGRARTSSSAASSTSSPTCAARARRRAQFGLFDPQQDRDGATLVRWAAHRANSDGKVGMYGASYLGIDQLLTAAALPKGSPLKAIFPVVPGNDLYKDTATMGGLVDIEFDAFYLALTGGLNTVGPLLEGLQNPATLEANLPAEIDHLKDLANFDAKFTAQTLSGGASAYDGKYWHARNPVNVLHKIAANGIPAYMVGGEYDLFQRGEPLDFTGLQNAWAGRPVTAPMLAAPARDRALPVAGRAVHAPVRIDGGAEPAHAGMVRHLAQGPAHRHGDDADAAALLRSGDEPATPSTPAIHSRQRTRRGIGSAPNKTLATARPKSTTSTTLLLDTCGQPLRAPDRPVVGRCTLARDRLCARGHAVRRRRRLERAGRAVPDDLHDAAARGARHDRRADRRDRRCDGDHHGHPVGRRDRGRRARRHLDTAHRRCAARLACATSRRGGRGVPATGTSCCRTTPTRNGTPVPWCPAG